MKIGLSIEGLIITFESNNAAKETKRSVFHLILKIRVIRCVLNGRPFYTDFKFFIT